MLNKNNFYLHDLNRTISKQDNMNNESSQVDCGSNWLVQN